MRGLLALLLLALAGCQASDVPRSPTAQDFPKADRPISKTVSNAYSSESARDKVNEARSVMDLAAIQPGTTVADIGAGEGYYTVRLAERVGVKGRVLAQDIDPAVLHRLGRRVEKDRLDNVSIQLGAAENPKLPPNSFDRVFLMHMYHEVSEPYAFLWHLRPAMKAGGKVIVVDEDNPADQHGMPPALLFCEFQALGYRLSEFVRKPELTGYYAAFEVTGSRPEPDAIVPCRLGGKDKINRTS